MRGLAVLDELVQEADRQAATMVALVLEDDLGQGHGGEVFAPRPVDDGDLLAPPDHLFDLLEGHVPTLFGVVEFPIPVSPDYGSHGPPLGEVPLSTDESDNNPPPGP